MDRNESAVRHLLESAGLRLTDEEVAQLATTYPAHRRMVETLYAVATTTDDEPQFSFSPELVQTGADGGAEGARHEAL